MKGKIISVNVSDNEGEKKHNIERCVLREGHGLDATPTPDPGRRVSLLAAESIEKIRKMGIDVKPGDFAENLTTEGVRPDAPDWHAAPGGRGVDEGHPDRKGMPREVRHLSAGGRLRDAEGGHLHRVISAARSAWEMR